ncbi:restriction endonuclease subunit S [Bifidobacterium pseudolongum]|nr:restriction endonuclease subunit S [Bifidobacterium pseudolongum]RYQ46221.1 type I restriction-modification system specificity determinant [Bifidobacterium pseudolongum subsp. globosum]RYQ56893.1 type I restriction-modification system specificity determinant [Bifidobacterium pseudolongum subsp. globosum]RYQ78588.1 type I restriction-modification system specificity determinant [Bifidobacterium pseudolongum subsp. globosum]
MTANGYPWLGKVPTSWKMGRLGTMCSILTDGTHQTPTYVDAGIPFLSIKDVSSGYIDFSDAKMIPLEEHTELRRHAPVQRGDILFTRIGTLGKFVTVDTDVEFSIFVSLGLLRLKNNVPVTKDYLMYYLNSSAVQSYIQSIKAGFGTAAPKYNLSDAAHTPVLIPPKETQEAITRHLDVICQPIDMCSKDIKRQVDALEQYRRSVIHEAVTKGLNPDAPMKDSGIPWIGEIPAGWDVVKGKYMFSQRSSRGNTHLELLSPTQKYGVIPQSLYEERTGAKTVKLKEDTDLQEFKTVHVGDYVISLRSFQGGFEYSDYEGVVSPVYQVFYPISNGPRGYYRYLFKTQPFIDEMNSYAMSLRDGKNIAFADFGRTRIPVPPLDEQHAIADYLDMKCADADKLIDAKREQLRTLAEYKKSLIYEYVTGKREVPA